jgi:hypothetical protein
MNIRNTGHKSKAEKIRNKDIIDEAHREIDDFRETKKSVTDLLKYRQDLLKSDQKDSTKIREVEDKALGAINHLFDEELKSKPE